MKVPMRPIIQALEFQISAVFVNPRKGPLNFGSTFGISTWNFQNPFRFHSQSSSGNTELGAMKNKSKNDNLLRQEALQHGPWRKLSS